MAMPDINRFPIYFKQYEWQDKHGLYGYPSDTYPAFQWINSLEVRFNWLRQNHVNQRTASIYLLREMIQWGGSQNGVLQKFDDRLGEIDVNLYATLKETISHLNTPAKAIESALKLPGMGLTYASKLLRFLDPEKYGALDSRVRGALFERVHDANLPKIYDGNVRSMVKGYVAFLAYINTLERQLATANIQRPECGLKLGSHAGWRVADIEMALFKWAEEKDSL